MLHMPKQISRHIKMIQIHKQLNPLLLGTGTNLVIEISPLWIQLLVLIHQSAPLNRGSEGVQSKTLEKLNVLLIFFIKIISHIASDLIVKIGNRKV